MHVFLSYHHRALSSEDNNYYIYNVHIQNASLEFYKFKNLSIQRQIMMYIAILELQITKIQSYSAPTLHLALHSVTFAPYATKETLSRTLLFASGMNVQFQLPMTFPRHLRLHCLFVMKDSSSYPPSIFKVMELFLVYMSNYWSLMSGLTAYLDCFQSDVAIRRFQTLHSNLFTENFKVDTT